MLSQIFLFSLVFFFLSVAERKTSDFDVEQEDEMNCCFKQFLETPKLLLQCSFQGPKLISNFVMQST